MGSNRNYVDDEIVAQLTLFRKVKQVWRRRDNCLWFLYGGVSIFSHTKDHV